jgi:hypothetical protein
MHSMWSLKRACLLAWITILPIACAPAQSAPSGGPILLAAATEPAENSKIDVAIAKGVAYLVKSQQPNGAWGTGLETRGTEIYSMVPGSHDAFRVATTALCVMALREAGEQEAHDKGLKYLVEHGEARRDAGPLMYNTWAHIYGLQCLSIEYKLHPDPKIKEAALYHLDRLQRYETWLGGWNYYDFDAQTQRPAMGPTSFGTAAGLVALYDAKSAGIDVPKKMIDLAIKRLTEMRLPNGAFLYAEDLKYAPRHPANHLRGSIGRNQSGHFALWLWGAGGIDEAKVREGLDVFFKEHDYIQMGQKRPYPHESWYYTAPYYYYFGHYYAARLIEKLGPSGREAYAQRLADVGILPYQEPDGTWWDYAMWDYHKPYGTAFSIMTLLRCK